MEILFDTIVSSNLSCGDAGVACAYPLSAGLADGTVFCTYRRGTAKHSQDGILVGRRSADGGRSWHTARPVFDGCGMDPTQTVVTGGLCQTPGGDLIAVMGTVEGLPQGVYLFSESGSQCPRHLLTVRSRDGGESWGRAIPLDLPSLEKAGITAPPFVTADGAVAVPIEHRLAGGNRGTALALSRDDGHTFEPPVSVAVDEAGQLNLCDVRFDVLPSGRILALLWAFGQDSERTIEVRAVHSDDHGQRWSAPRSIGFVGQITAPLALSEDLVIAVSNHRQPPVGSLLWISRDGGESWETDTPILLWDADQNTLCGEPVTIQEQREADERVWDDLPLFTFGTPDLVRLGDRSVLLTYYAEIDGITHVRAAGLSIGA